MELVIALGVAALLTRVGFAFYAMGLVRAKNSAGAVMRAIADLCLAVIAFWMVGAAILVQGNNPWFGINREFLFGPSAAHSIASAPQLFFYTAMILTATTAVSGALSERVRFLPLCIASLVLSGLLLPAMWNWAWIGWFGAKHGFIDVAGGCSLQMSAGIFAMVGVAMAGPRSGKFNRDGSSSMIPGHNLPLAAIGALVLLAGWIPYVAGATTLRAMLKPETQAFFAGAAAMNVLVATATAGLTSMLLSQFRYGKPDILLTLTALLGAMVSVCAGGAALPSWAAVVTGAVAGVIVPAGIVLIDLRAKLDDPLGMIGIQTIGGAWGTLAAGLFATPVSPLNRLQQIGMQLFGIVVVATVSAVVGMAVFGAIKATVGLRAKESDEFEGLDLAEHDIGAYPDFQQNTIKSYHLREA